MELLTFNVGVLQSNCYVLINDKKQCIMIDCGGDFDYVYSKLNKRELTLLGVLLTHGHIDHIKGVEDAQNFAPIYIFEGERDFLDDDSLNLCRKFGMSFEKTLNVITFSEGEFNIGDFKIRAVKTSGHTRGSVCFYIDGMLFSGDTLFYGSYGRCDLNTGNFQDIVNSVNMLLNTYPPETKVYPGHGISTTILIERNINPLSRYDKD